MVDSCSHCILPSPHRSFHVWYFPTIQQLISGWTARPAVHWIASVVGIGIYSFGVFTIFQCVFIYVPLTYPKYAASLFAGNDFCRSSLAAGAILFARPLFLNLGVGGGVSLLAGLTCVCVVCVSIWRRLIFREEFSYYTIMELICGQGQSSQSNRHIEKGI